MSVMANQDDKNLLKKRRFNLEIQFEGSTGGIFVTRKLNARSPRHCYERLSKPVEKRLYSKASQDMINVSPKKSCPPKLLILRSITIY